jgi:hypothetical protein
MLGLTISQATIPPVLAIWYIFFREASVGGDSVAGHPLVKCEDKK